MLLKAPSQRIDGGMTGGGLARERATRPSPALSRAEREMEIQHSFIIKLPRVTIRNININIKTND